MAAATRSYVVLQAGTAASSEAGAVNVTAQWNGPWSGGLAETAGTAFFAAGGDSPAMFEVQGTHCILPLSFTDAWRLDACTGRT